MDFQDLSCDWQEIAKYCRKNICSNPKVSVIVPVYNTEKYIARCIFSLIRQTLEEIEIIIIDDGSTDNTAEVIRKFTDARIKFLSQENLKQGAARNRGLRIASGEYVGFVDSDDWVSDEYFEKLYTAAKKYDSDLAIAANIRIGNGRTKKRLHIENEVFVRDLQDRIDISKQAKNPCPTNKIYRRKLLLDNNIFYPEGVYCEDKLFTMKSLYYANGLAAVPGVYYFYFRNPHSTVLYKTRKRDDKNRAHLAVLEFLRNQNAPIRDGDFKAVKKEFAILGIALFRYEESLRSAGISLFGVQLSKWKMKDRKNG